MSTSKTYQQSLAEAGSETRPPMLERGSYIPWASRFKRFLNRKRENQKWLLKALEDGPYVFRNITPTGSALPRLQDVDDLEGDDLLYYDAEMELTNMILLSISNEIYNSVDSCKTAKEMWDHVERLMRGTIQNQVDRETRLQPEWLKYVTQVCLAKKLTVDSFDDLFDYLSQFEKLVNTSRAKKLEKSHDPLALVAQTGSSSRNTSSYYVTHPPSVVDYDEEFEQDDVHNHSEDPLASAMLLLAKAITQNFSNPTNNRLRASSNTRNQAVVQGDRVNIQSRNSGNDEADVILSDEQNDFLFADASSITPRVLAHTLEATHVELFSDEDKPEVDLGNITNSYTVPTTPNTRTHKDHPIENVIGDVKSSVQTRRMTKPTSEQRFLSAVFEQKTHNTLNTYLFACFLSQSEPTSIAKALSDSS
ncbi:hypothetical protein Tco_0968175 [Tanacetum coccineum]